MAWLKYLLLAAVVMVALLSMAPATAHADDYWNGYWGWYDNTYTPYYGRYYSSSPSYYGSGYSVGPAYGGAYYGAPSYYGGYPGGYGGAYYGTPNFGYQNYGAGMGGVRVGRLGIGWR